MVRFTNGGALALKYALDALDDNTLAQPDRLVLISPMIGITSFARFVGLVPRRGAPAIAASPSGSGHSAPTRDGSHVCPATLHVARRVPQGHPDGRATL